jgi:hypothetical protein
VFTQELVKAAFKFTVIHPFNPDIVAPEQMKPSQLMSVNSHFPLVQTSPTWAVMATFQYQYPIMLELSPFTH